MRTRLRQVAGVAAAIALVATVWSVLSADARPLALQPYPDAQEYADAANQLAKGHGYVTRIYKGTSQPPRYPPGFSLALAPFAKVGKFPANVEGGAKAFAVLYVLAIALVAWWLGGPIAGLIAGIVVGVSPFARQSAGLVMSDAFGATLAVLALPFLRPLTRSGTAVAGSLLGFMTVVRLNAIAAVVGLVAAVGGRLRLTAVLWSLPALLGLALLQWATFGSPFETGYAYWHLSERSFETSYLLKSPPRGDGPYIFSDLLHGDLAKWACPCPPGGPQADLSNLAFYPFLLLGGFWIFAPPFFVVPGLITAVRERHDPVARFVLATVVLTFGLFVFFFYQGARFMAAPAALLIVLSSMTIARGIETWFDRGSLHR
jgi:hypothetical protein